jgi:hypothetical protein
LEIPASWVDVELCGSFCCEIASFDAGEVAPNPGKRKDAGETLREALTPLHPAATTSSNDNIAKRASFQFNFTLAV